MGKKLFREIREGEDKEEYLEEKICRIDRGRRIYKSREPFARLVWNTFNPQDPVIKCSNFRIHHKDLQKLNDNIENLQKLTMSEHSKLHRRLENIIHIPPSFKGRKHSEESKKKMSMSNKGKKLSESTKRKLSDLAKKRKHSKNAKLKISLSRRGYKNKNSRIVMVEYMFFETINRASKVLDIHPTTIIYRIKAHKPGYFYIS